MITIATPTMPFMPPGADGFLREGTGRLQAVGIPSLSFFGKHHRA
jgi:hypothetical protein